ncbi:MAG: ribosome biogenesis GTPase Der [Bacilli bacterium]|jgi:GTP-binding protein
MNKLSTVAIIGSPNVGKSTLFNRLIGERKAIIDDERGVTRDRIYAPCEWLNVKFNLIDTGGLEIEDVPLKDQINAQVHLAIDEADVIVFVVDGQVGVTENDDYIARILRQINKPVIIAANKIDDIMHISATSEFYQLGFNNIIAVSSAHGIGVGDLLDEIVKAIPIKETSEDENGITFCVIGQPNVGKSSLINALIKKDRVIVSPIAGTTRDMVDIDFTREGKKYTIIDTAGLKKRGRIIEDIDKYAMLRAMLAIERSDIALFVIDADEGIRKQDKHVVGYAVEKNKAIIIVVNKWDIAKDKYESINEFTSLVRAEFKFLDYSPIVIVSAKTGLRVDTIFEKIDYVYEAYNRHIATNLLNAVINDAQLINEAPLFKGGRLKIYYITQVATRPPTFVLFVNNPNYLHFSYKRYIENKLREAFVLDGTPIKLIFRERK